MDSSEKPPGVVYVVVLVSTQSRRDGIEQSAVQSVVDALRRIHEFKVFFADRGYLISTNAGGTGTYGLLGSAEPGSNTPGSIFYFDSNSEAAAHKAQAAIEKLTEIKFLQQRTPSDKDIGIGTNLQAVWRVSGIDIEVVL